ncbi:hypothetical protein BFW01_g5734 [Lasiodiplodia theobromae]|nr:hypothetical protein BFW01_g5734 [Lasiodiplodia theobromae]
MVGFGQATIGLLLARVAAAQSFTNTSTPATGNNSTETCTYSPSDCSARSSVLSCQALHTSWYSDRNSWTASVTTSSSPAYSYEYSSVIWLGNQSTSLSTLCDGVLRGGKPPAITSTSTTTFYEYFPQYPVPEPTCTYDYNACALLISEYRDAPRGPTASVAPRYPACAWDTEECFNPAGAICPIKVGEVKLIYWPQSKDPSKLCANSTSELPASITASPTGPPVTTVIGSYTLTSPTVYLSYPYMEALLCWKSFRDIIVPLTNPADLSSISFVSPAQSSKTMSFNWDDLNSPVPLAAYKGQQSCVEIWNTVRTPFDNCSTVYDDYNPWLVLPTNPLVYTDIDPRFKNCTSIQYSKYVIDPPLALTTAGLLVPEPSSAPPVTSRPEATGPASETASPAPEPAPPTVTATTTQAVPVTQPTADPEDPADPPSDPPADPPADPADPPTTTGGGGQGGGGLGPIISQIASSAAAGQPNNPPADDPAAPPANDNDPSTPADPGSNNNNDNNPPPPVVTIIPAPDPSSNPSDPSDPSNPDNSGSGGNTGGDPVVVASPANDPANPGAVVVVIAGPAGGGSDPAAGASITTTLLPGATGILPGGTAGSGSVTVAVPSAGGAVVVGGTETVVVPAAGVTAAGVDVREYETH